MMRSGLTSRGAPSQWGQRRTTSPSPTYRAKYGSPRMHTTHISSSDGGIGSHVMYQPQSKKLGVSSEMMRTCGSSVAKKCGLIAGWGLPYVLSMRSVLMLLGLMLRMRETSRFVYSEREKSHVQGEDAPQP